MNVVISQSMYFPWIGMLQQVRHADVFVHYDDVQFSKGSFTNRVQIKQVSGSTGWMTVPLKNLKLGQLINEVALQDPKTWVPRHMVMLDSSFALAPYARDALDLAEYVLSKPYSTISQLARASLMALCDYFGLTSDTKFIDSASLNIDGESSQRVFDIVKALGGSRYVTGHGALRYLDHSLFELGGIEVSYMQYQCKSYPQSYGAFTPYVSALDLIAHTGPRGIDYIQANYVHWRKFQSESA